MAKKSVIVSLEDDKSLLTEVIGKLTEVDHKIHIGEIRKQDFSDNEHCPDFQTSVRGRRVFILCTPNSDKKIMQLLFTIDAARRARAAEIIPIVTYFPYARQDKKDQPRGPIGAKVVARCLETQDIDGLVTFDLHAEQIQGFFQIGVTHMDGKYIFLNEIKNIIDTHGDSNVVLVSPDAGGGKRVKHFRDLILKTYGVDIPMVMMDKTREKANEVGKIILIGEVEGKHAIIIDDMCDTAGTLCKAAEVLVKEKGALSVNAVVTHGVLSGPAYERIEASTLSRFICSNTLPVKANEKITVVSIANQIMLAIIAEDKGKSIEGLEENEFKWE